jgi:hypothetical protein
MVNGKSSTFIGLINLLVKKTENKIDFTTVLSVRSFEKKWNPVLSGVR